MTPNATSSMIMAAALSASAAAPQPTAAASAAKEEEDLFGFLPFGEIIDVDDADVDANAAPSTISPPSPYSSASSTYVSDYSSHSHIHSHSHNQSFVVDDTPSSSSSSSTTLTIDEEELLLSEPIGAVVFTEHEEVVLTPTTTSTAAPHLPPSQPLLLPECGVSGGMYHHQQRPFGPPLPLPRVGGGGGGSTSSISTTTTSSFHQQQAATASPAPAPGSVPFLTMDELFRKVQQDRLMLQQQQQQVQNQKPKQQMKMVSHPTSSDEAMLSTSMSMRTSSPFSNLQVAPTKMVAIWENDGDDKDTEHNLSTLTSSIAERQHQEQYRRSSTVSTSSSISTKSSSSSSSSSPALVDSPERQHQHPKQTHNPKFRDYQTEQWFDRYDELVKFYQAQGHSSVPHTDTSNKCLARWVKRQRYQYKLRQDGKPSAMTNERIKLLENLGFVWDSHSSAWDDRLRELEDFKSIHKHCNVPSNYRRNTSLASWIKCQRRQYRLFHEGKKSNMTPRRIEQLERIGFRFNVRDD